MGTPTHGFVPHCRGLGNWLVVFSFYFIFTLSNSRVSAMISDYTLGGEWFVPYLIISLIYRPGWTDWCISCAVRGGK